MKLSKKKEIQCISKVNFRKNKFNKKNFLHSFKFILQLFFNLTIKRHFVY